VTNKDYIQSCDKEELAKFLCHETQTLCSRCVAQGYCYAGHVGFLDWLDKERRGEKE